MKLHPSSLFFAVMLCEDVPTNKGDKKDRPTKNIDNNLFSTI